MDAMFSTLGMGTRYCLVSDDHERPEVYADEQERCPQTTLERFTDFDNVYDKFSRPAPSASRREAELGRTLAGRRSGSGEAGAQQGKENTVPRAAADAVMALFDRLAQRHDRAEISSFDRRFPLAHRVEKSACPAGDSVGASPSRRVVVRQLFCPIGGGGPRPGLVISEAITTISWGGRQADSRLVEIDSSSDPFNWSGAAQYSDATSDGDISKRVNSAWVDASQRAAPAPVTLPNLATPPLATPPSATPRPEQSCDQEVLIDLS